MAAFAGDLRSLAATIEPGRGAPSIDAAKLINENPNFWRSYYEIVPGDPLAISLHAGLLLAAGEAARANQVLTLAIGFGRMGLEERKALVRLQVYAQLMLYASQRSMEGLARMRSASPAALAERARAVLAVWPQSPDALAILAEALWMQERRPTDAPAHSPWRACVEDLRRVDPLYALDSALSGPEPEALIAVRSKWVLIRDGKAIGDEQALDDFSQAAQAADLDELALVSRGLLAGRRGAFAPVDEKFLRTSLERSIGPGKAALICTDLFKDRSNWVGLTAQGGSEPAGFGPASIHPQLAEQMLVRIAESSFWIEASPLEGVDMAASYRQRGSAWAQLLNWDEAVADLRRALELDPSDTSVRHALAVTLSDAGHFEEADAMFAEAKKKSPPGVYEMESWGNHLFKQGRFTEAEAVFAQAEKMDPDFAYARIMRHLARLRQGKDGSAAEASPAGEDRWGAGLVDFLAGRIDELTLFGRLVPEGGMRYSEQECELHFVLGELALSRDDRAEARRQFQSCLGTGISSFVEYAMAWHELRRLDAPLEPDEKKKEERLPAQGTGSRHAEEPA